MAGPKNMSRLWDQRYGTEEYAYGKEANVFFSAQLAKLNPGNILLPGEGEGRNAVFSARQGWAVDAFDLSREGHRKAMAMASEFGIEIKYRVCPMEDFNFIPNHYDALALLYFHTDPPDREYLHRKVYDTLKPGGSLILEGFHKEQVKNDSGGPKSLDMLFDEETLAEDFALFETRILEKKEIALNEGLFHQGMAEVIRYLGIKPK